MKRMIIGAAALLSLPLAVLAQSEQQKPKVTPGTDATQQMSKEVPPMKEECAQTAQVDTKAKGTEATEAMNKNVPTMTAEKKDCPPAAEKTKKN